MSLSCNVNNHNFFKDMYAAFKGKHALVLSASPGALGGLRSLPIVRAVLNNMGTNVVASQVFMLKLVAAGFVCDT